LLHALFIPSFVETRVVVCPATPVNLAERSPIRQTSGVLAEYLRLLRIRPACHKTSATETVGLTS